MSSPFDALPFYIAGAMNNFPSRRASHGNLIWTALGYDSVMPHNARKAHVAKRGPFLMASTALCAPNVFIGRIRFPRRSVAGIPLRPIILAIYIYIYTRPQFGNIRYHRRNTGIYMRDTMVFRPFLPAKNPAAPPSKRAMLIL